MYDGQQKSWVPIHRYPASLVILIAPILFFTLSYSEHLGPAYGAHTLGCWLTILHGYGLSVLHFPFGPALHTICLHCLYLSFCDGE